MVVDEASMLDVELAAALLRACADGTHLMFVGDSAQLPSIGPGQVLADLIASGAVPVVELATLYRQDAGGAIARLATAVRAGELPAVDSPDREVVIVPARGSADCAHRVVQLMTDSIPRALGIETDQIQVVTPVHRGPAGTIELNAALKARLNPSPFGKAAGRFDPGDRVVATANHLEATPTGFANGEVGTVTAVRDRVVTIDFGTTAPALAEVSGQDAGRHQPRLGDHGAPGAGLGVPRRDRGAAAGGGPDAVPAAGLHRADPGPGAPVGGARQRPGAGPGCPRHRRHPAPHDAGRLAPSTTRVWPEMKRA